MSKPKPVNRALYERVKREAKKKFDVYPSIYANSWLVREYKKRGGKYSGDRNNKEGLLRWYEEQWIDICQLPRRVKCGRPKASIKSWKKTYPYCRPLRKVSSKTPRTALSISRRQRSKICKKKKKSPRKRMKRLPKRKSRHGSVKKKKRSRTRVRRKVSPKRRRKRSN